MSTRQSSITRKGKAAPPPAAVESKKKTKVVDLPTLEEPTTQKRSFDAELDAVRSRVQDAARKSKKKKAVDANFLAKPPTKGKKYTADLRVHSPATKGYFSTGGVDTDAALVRVAKVKGIDIMGITDYYTGAAIDSVRQAVGKANITIIPGFDLVCQVGSCREVHLTALFPEETTSQDLARVLRELAVPQSAAGRRDFVLTQPLTEILAIIEGNGGVCIPSRVDKTPYRQLAIRELIECYGFHAFDLVHEDNTEFFKENWIGGEFTFFTFSNANALAQIGTRVATVKLAQPGFLGIKELVSRRSGPRA